MVNEGKNVDFTTTGRKPSAAEFDQISKWIQQHRLKQARQKLQSSKQDGQRKNKSAAVHSVKPAK